MRSASMSSWAIPLSLHRDGSDQGGERRSPQGALIDRHGPSRCRSGMGVAPMLARRPQLKGDTANGPAAHSSALLPRDPRRIRSPGMHIRSFWGRFSLPLPAKSFSLAEEERSYGRPPPVEGFPARVLYVAVRAVPATPPLGEETI